MWVLKIWGTDINTIKIASWFTPRLPSGYQEVEYIQNNTYSRIDTGLTAKAWYKIEYKLYTDSSSNSDQTVIWCEPNQDNCCYLGLNYGSSYRWLYFYYNQSWHDATNLISVWNIYVGSITLRDGNQTAILNGNTVWTDNQTLTETGTKNLWIFGRGYGSSNRALIKLYYMKIYDENDDLLRDFIPGIRESDNAIGMYDLVNDVFYVNDGYVGYNFLAWPSVNLYKDIKVVYKGSTRIWPDPYYDISTSSMISRRYSFTEYTDVQGFYITVDGLNLYVDFWNNGSGRLIQYSLSTAWDVSNITYIREINVTQPDWIFFSPDWVYMFIWCESPSSIKRYTLSTPWDISTATQDQTYNTGGLFPYWASFSDDWLHMCYWWNDNRTDKTVSCDLWTAWDLTTITNLYITSSLTYGRIDANGEFFYGNMNNKMVQLKPNIPYTLSWWFEQVWEFNRNQDGWDDRRWLFIPWNGHYRTSDYYNSWIVIYETQLV